MDDSQSGPFARARGHRVRRADDRRGLPAREPAEARRLGRQDRQVRRRQAATSSGGPGSSVRWAPSSSSPGSGRCGALMRRAEGGAPRLAVGAALGGGFAAALFTVAGVIMSVVAIVGVRAHRSAGNPVLLPAVQRPRCRRMHRPRAVRRCVLDRDHRERGAASGDGLARRAARARPARRRWRDRVDTRHLLRPRLHRLRRPRALGHRRQRDDVSGPRAPRCPRRRHQRRSARAARVPRAGNASGRVPSASLTAFHAAAATAANTASDALASGGTGIVDDLDVDRRRVLGADDAERPDGEVVDLAGRRGRRRALR